MFTHITAPPDLVLLPSGKIVNLANVTVCIPPNDDCRRARVYTADGRIGYSAELNRADYDALRTFVEAAGGKL